MRVSCRCTLWPLCYSCQVHGACSALSCLAVRGLVRPVSAPFCRRVNWGLAQRRLLSIYCRHAEIVATVLLGLPKGDPRA